MLGAPPPPPPLRGQGGSQKVPINLGDPIIIFLYNNIFYILYSIFYILIYYVFYILYSIIIFYYWRVWGHPPPFRGPGGSAVALAAWPAGASAGPSFPKISWPGTARKPRPRRMPSAWRRCRRWFGITGAWDHLSESMIYITLAELSLFWNFYLVTDIPPPPPPRQKILTRKC